MVVALGLKATWLTHEMRKIDVRVQNTRVRAWISGRSLVCSGIPIPRRNDMNGAENSTVVLALKI
jgi:hypothetical protein